MLLDKRTLKIILIDDNDLSLQTMQKSFRLNGYHVDASNNPKKALAMHKLNHYDLVLSDIMMPDLNGFQLATKIKAATPTTKVILFTGFYTDEKARLGLAAGADRVYPKPLPIFEILDELKQYK